MPYRYREPTLAYDEREPPTFVYDNQAAEIDTDDNGYSHYIPRTRIYSGPARQLGRYARIFIPLSIMSIEMFERMAYFTLTAGILKFAVLTLNYNALGSGLFLAGCFAGGAYLTAPIGGLSADALFGRFYTILCSTMLYIAGLVLVIAASLNLDYMSLPLLELNTRNYLVLTGLALVAAGSGGIKANVPPFGADQVKSLGDYTLTSYYHWYYLVTNLGSAVAMVAIFWLQTEKHIGTRLLIPLVGMVVALIAFAALRRKYVRTSPRVGATAKWCAIFKQGCCKSIPSPNPKLPEGAERCLFARSMQSFGGQTPDHLAAGCASLLKLCLLPFFLVPVWMGIHQARSILPTKQAPAMDSDLGFMHLPESVITAFYHLALLLSVLGLIFGVLPLSRFCQRRFRFLSRLGIGIALVAAGLGLSGVVEQLRKGAINDGSFKTLGHRTSPGVTQLVIKMALADMTLPAKQATNSHKNVTNISHGGLMVTGVNAATQNSIIASRGLNRSILDSESDKTARLLNDQKMPPITHQSAATAKLVAEFVDKITHNPPDGFPLWRLTPDLNVSDLSVLTQIPSFVLVGTGEALSAVAALELVYNQVPFGYQGFLTGLFVAAVGGGSFLLTLAVNLVSEYTPQLCTGLWFSITSDINQTHLDYFMYLGAALVALILFLFLPVAFCYRYTDPVLFEAIQDFGQEAGMEMKTPRIASETNSQIDLMQTY